MKKDDNNLQDNCLHNFEDNICKTCGFVVEKTIRDLDKLGDLTDEQHKKVWDKVDEWYQNADLWDLLEMSGVIDTPLKKLGK